MIDRSLKRRRALRDHRRATLTNDLSAEVSAAVAYAFEALPRYPSEEDWEKCWARLEELGFESPLDPADPN